jgi:hypothetical protein
MDYDEDYEDTNERGEGMGKNVQLVLRDPLYRETPCPGIRFEDRFEISFVT